MRKQLISIIFVFSLFSILILLISAIDCSRIVMSSNTNDFFNEISSINNKLSQCSVLIPGKIGGLIGDGSVQVNMAMNDGSLKGFYFSIKSKQIVNMFVGTDHKSNYIVSLDENSLDTILQSNDKAGTILTLYSNKKIVIKGNTFLAKFKLFFAKFFIPKKTPVQNTQTPSNSVTGTTPTGKPEYCDGTYLPGHKGYAENKELWDSYSSDTDDVCQSQYGKGVPSPCIHTVQLSIEGKPYYLCWYNK